MLMTYLRRLFPPRAPARDVEAEQYEAGRIAASYDEPLTWVQQRLGQHAERGWLDYWREYGATPLPADLAEGDPAEAALIARAQYHAGRKLAARDLSRESALDVYGEFGRKGWDDHKQEN